MKKSLSQQQTTLIKKKKAPDPRGVRRLECEQNSTDRKQKQLNRRRKMDNLDRIGT